jgi:hypothetical protein
LLLASANCQLFHPVDLLSYFIHLIDNLCYFVVLQKPVNLLAFGVAAMLLSYLILLCLIFHICKEFYFRETRHFDSISGMYTWNLAETFILGVMLILVISMGSSSMVEEEQYIWHFVTSTLDLLLLRKTMQSLPARKSRSSFRLYIYLALFVLSSYEHVFVL